jgi:hypothetical protein
MRSSFADDPHKPYGKSSNRISKLEWDDGMAMDATQQAQAKKSELLALNRVPDGKAAWLTYRQYRELQMLFEAATAQYVREGEASLAVGRLHRFLIDVARLDLPNDDDAIQFNAFVLLRRGYSVEYIAAKEYKTLARLMAQAEEPDLSDMTLHNTGTHRAIYEFLTKELGLYVEPGRGPVWYRAQRLIDRNKKLQSLA